MSKSFEDWLQEGERLYDSAMKDYQNIEAQLDELEKKLADKQDEVNQIAKVIGKPTVEGNRRITAQIVDREKHEPASPSIIARALTGKQIAK